MRHPLFSNISLPDIASKCRITKSGRYAPCAPHAPQALLLSLSLTLAGCDVLFDSAVDCIDSDGPSFNKSTLLTPVLNQVYDETLLVRIENEPFDDRFAYEFDIVGELPEGITWTQQLGNGRRIFFEGTPIEEGEFNIRVLVAVSDPDMGSAGTSGLCFLTRSRRFNLTVAPL